MEKNTNSYKSRLQLT